MQFFLLSGFYVDLSQVRFGFWERHGVWCLRQLGCFLTSGLGREHKDNAHDDLSFVPHGATFKEAFP